MTVRSRARRWAVPLVMSSLLVLATAGGAFAQATVHVVVAFDESKAQNPEGIAIGRTGSIFVSVSPLGDVWRIPPGSTQPQPFGHVNGITPGADFGLLGLAVDVFGNVYGAVQSANPAANGVWRFDRNTGAATRLPGTAAIGLANGLAFDKQMNLYVTDSARGAIWRIPWDGSASIWLQDPALTGDGSLGLNLGANGIADPARPADGHEHRAAHHAADPQGGWPARLDLRCSTSLPAGDNPDGVTMDVFGDAFVAMNLATRSRRSRPPAR